MTQLGFDLDGAALRDQGIARAEAGNADAVRLVRESLVALSERRGYVTADDARDVARELGVTLRGPQFGAVFAKTRAGYWQAVGEPVPSRVASNHSHRNPRRTFVRTEEGT